MSRVTTVFQSADADNGTLLRIPLTLVQGFPGRFIEVSLLNVNWPFDFGGDGVCGHLLISVPGVTPHYYNNPGGISAPYTWCLPFDVTTSHGLFSYFSQSATDEAVRIPFSGQSMVGLELQLAFHSVTGGPHPLPHRVWQGVQP